MKKQLARVLCLLLSIAMVFSLLPVSVFAADVQEGGGIATQAAEDLTIPGYAQVTQLNQIRADRNYLIVAQAPAIGTTTPVTLYALYLNEAGASKGPGDKGHPECTATLTVSGSTVTAVKTADTSANLPMNDLHVTITKSGTGYTITNSSHALTLGSGNNNKMFTAAGSAPALPLAFTGDGRFAVTGSGTNRYLTFNLNGAATGQTHYPNLSTGFCGWNDPQTGDKYYIPIYLFIEGELPVDPGINLPQMLSGDKIDTAAGAPEKNENPDGQNSWVFTGGRAAQGSFTDIAGARSFAGHFEEWIRYTQTKTIQSGNESSSPYFQRHVINAAYTGQTLAQIVSTFDDRIAPLKPRAVSYLVDEGAGSASDFAANLNSLITKALGLQGGTGMIVIETLTEADKAAVDNVVNGLDNEKKVRVLPVLFTLTDEQKTDGYPNAKGHLAMAKQLADAVAGTTVSTAANWPYGAISGSTLDNPFPNKTSTDHTHGYTNPTTLSEGQQAVKDGVDDEETPMTWLFMGDSITHGAAWTGGYDTLAQLFEKFLKDDLERPQDIVINAGSSGATTSSTVSDLNRRLVKYDPDVVVVMLGTNDASSHVSVDTYKGNIRTILDKIDEKGAVAVLRTPPPTTNTGYDIATYAQYAREVAAETKYDGKVILVDQYGLWTQQENWSTVFTRDTSMHLHPDEAGHLWFTHQLIKELALWNDNYKICKLEYKDMKEVEPIVIPDYTQITDVGQIDETKGYLIVSQSADGELYALYPSVDGETLGAGALVAPGDANDGARAAHLHINDQTVTANWLKGGSDGIELGMEKLLFTIKQSGSGYVIQAFNGRHLNMAAQMFTEGSVELTITARGTVAPGAFAIANPTAPSGSGIKPRYLDFTKNGDPNAFAGNFGTDFWAPQSMSMRIYLFESTVKAPTAKESLQALIEEVGETAQGTYTRSSWDAFQSALTAAQRKVADTTIENDDDPQYTTTLDALRKAYEGLREIVTTVPAGATAKEWKAMVPDGGTTTNQPYIAGQTGGTGSTNFRIPAMITLQHQKGDYADLNGRIVTAMDARWNHAGDACGLDTVVSYSDDDGENWTYNFPNYFGDSTDTKQTNAAAFIDPVMVEALDGTIYLMVDVWPGGIALNTAPYSPATATGYETIDGKLRLVLYTAPLNNSDSAVYDYYVDDFAGDDDAEKYAPVYDKTNAFIGYYVDEYYYLYYTAGDFAARTPASEKVWCQRLGDSNTWVQQNVFFWNADLHVRNASYLWIVKSTNGGESWSKPMMINDQVRGANDGARFYGVGPGAGLCMEDGTLLFPVYINSNERAGFIYSTDGGATWKRGNNATSDHSSESCLVQIDATTVRHFYRDSGYDKLRYTDHTWNNGSWTTTGDPVITDAIKTKSCQLSAIKYSEKINGKDAIIVSTAASGGTGRNTGKLYVFLVNDDENHTMELYNTYSVNGNAYYCYSSLTETKDGDIALLYEHAAAAVTFKIISITDLIPGLSVTSWEGGYDGEAHNVTVVTNPSTDVTLQYSTNDGTDWSDTLNLTDAGTYTVTVKATWANGLVRTESATVTINKATPTLTITTDKQTYEASEEATFTISGVPDEGTVTLTCSNTSTDGGHNPNITLTKKDDGSGDWTGIHDVKEGNLTFTAEYAGSKNYNAATATHRVIVTSTDFGLKVEGYAKPYDGQPHSIKVTVGEGVKITYSTEENGTYTETNPIYTNAGTYTTYFKVEKGTAEAYGSANVTITKATPNISITCSHDAHDGDENHVIETTDLVDNPLVLTITGVPAEDQGHFTLTSFGDAVRNLEHKGNEWVAKPNIPPISRTFTFVATFDPTKTQGDVTIPNPNYERVTAEFTVTVVRPADEVPDFTFEFVEGVKVEEETPLTGTLTVPYDGRYHSPLEALTYSTDTDKKLVLSYHIPVTENAGDDVPHDTWVAEEPTYRNPGTYTVSVMASPKDSPIARVLTVVLKIEEKVIPVTLTVTATDAEGTPLVDDEIPANENGVTVKLTVDAEGGLPEAGTLTVTCLRAGGVQTPVEGTRNQYTVALGSEGGEFAFTIVYSGAGSYQRAEYVYRVYVIEEEPEGGVLGGTLRISGNPVIGETLTPDFSDVTPASAAEDAWFLTCQWKRGDDINPEGTYEGYVLTAADIGKTITLVISGDGESYTGELTASIQIPKLAAPAAPNVTAENCSEGHNDDGKITGFDSGKTYEYRKSTDNGSTWTEWDDVTLTGTEFTGLEPGTYEIREKVDETIQEIGTAETGSVTTVVIYPHGTAAYAITVAACSNGTVTTAPSGSVAAGTQVIITVTPDEGYVLTPNSLTVTKTGGTETVAVTTNEPYTFEMPAYAVTVTASFEQQTTPPSTYTVTFDSKGGTPTPEPIPGVTSGSTVTAPADPERSGYTFGGWYTDESCTEENKWNFATNTVTTNVTLYAKWTANATPEPAPAPVAPITGGGSDTSTTTTTNPDGTVTTTVTDKTTGTVTETTEKPDGTVETKETLKDGTVTETTEKPDGSSEVVETKPDGTVTETSTDAEGAKVEKVTTPDEDVTITVTDKDGEELAKVEIPAVIPEPETRFVDVPEGHWSDEAIHNMAALDVVHGVGNNTYNRNGDMKRGDLALMLSRMSSGEENSYELAFADVPATKYYASGVAWAAKTGVVTGRSADTFDPENTITREELAVMLYRYAKLLKLDTGADAAALDGFTDGSNTHGWAEEGMAWCVKNGILQGKGNGVLDPRTNVTRAEVAVMLQRFVDLLK